MNNEMDIHINTRSFNERIENKDLSLFDIYKHLYPVKADSCISQTDKANAIRKIRNWQDGLAMPKTVNELLSLCELLDCDVEYLIGKQNFARRDNLDAMERTGLDYKAIDNLSKLQHGSYLDCLNLQCINYLLSSEENINNIVSLLSHLIFTMDNEEIDTLETTYNTSEKVSASEYEQEFIDKIASSDFNFLAKYGEMLYPRSYSNNMHLSSLLFELSKQLEAIRLEHKKLREEYVGNVQIALDYDKYIEENSTDATLEWYENKYNKALANKNINVSFID